MNADFHVRPLAGDRTKAIRPVLVHALTAAAVAFAANAGWPLNDDSDANVDGAAFFKEAQAGVNDGLVFLLADEDDVSDEPLTVETAQRMLSLNDNPLLAMLLKLGIGDDIREALRIGDDIRAEEGIEV